MSDLKDKLSLEEMTRNNGQPAVDGHDAWVRKRIQERLLKKKSGNMNYISLDDVASEFGFDAR